MRDITDLASQVREKLARLTALSDGDPPWLQGEWPDASNALSALTDAQRYIEKLHAHAHVANQKPPAAT